MCRLHVSGVNTVVHINRATYCRCWIETTHEINPTLLYSYSCLHPGHTHTHTKASSPQHIDMCTAAG